MEVQLGKWGKAKVSCAQKLVTVAEAAQALNVKKVTIRRWLRISADRKFLEVI